MNTENKQTLNSKQLQQVADIKEELEAAQSYTTDIDGHCGTAEEDDIDDLIEGAYNHSQAAHVKIAELKDDVVNPGAARCPQCEQPLSKQMADWYRGDGYCSHACRNISDSEQEAAAEEREQKCHRCGSVELEELAAEPSSLYCRNCDSRNNRGQPTTATAIGRKVEVIYADNQ